MKKIFLSISVIFAFVNAVNAQKTLQYKLNKNDTFKVNQKASQDIVQDMNGSKHEMKNVMEADFSFVVTEISNDGFIMDFTFDRFKMTTTSNLYGEIMAVDTDKKADEDDMEAKIFSGLVNVPLKMIMLKNGEIKSITGTEELVNKMIDGTGIEDEFTKQLMIEAMKKEFGSESLSSSFEQMTFIYPETQVAVGDTWKNEYTGDLKAQNTWTLSAMNETSLSLSGTSAVQMLSEEDEMTMDLKGTQDTAITAGTKNGFVITMKVTSQAKGTTIMKQMNGVKIPTTITSITEYQIQ